ncbi:MATE family efflux transporter [Aciduricibacillus chroicocephali]|uniref:Multidrug export protein MepA n=1 Tax=Aciduricibacillus chroicocephali TaxID=3054939 RepID=A0ABY9KX80_9BACI|nr:MATE family efflux transporter [Bacillaceae bacterium 44XB]
MNELKNTPVRKLFITYLVPSVLGLMLMSVNILIDGIFVSKGVGAEALAGVNIAVPVYSILLALSLWIGIGGGTLYSIAGGRGDWKEARQYFTQSLVWAIGIVGTIILLCLWKEKELALLFGADKEILPYVLDYLHIIVLYGLVYVLENILSIFIRNDGNPKLAMSGLIVNSVLNIILNYIFIFQFGWGIKGAAYATIIATFVGVIVMCSHFLRKKSQLGFVPFTPDLRKLKEILTIGFPSFIAEGTAAVMTVGYNVTFMSYVGKIGITAFAAVNYLHAVFLMFFLAVGAAIQPLVSYHHGAGLHTRAKQFRKYALVTGAVFGVIVFGVCLLFGKQLASLFNVTGGALLSYTVTGLTLFTTGYLFLSINMVWAEYCQAIKRTRAATIIILLRSIVFFLPLLWLLPELFGKWAIWLALPGAEFLTAASIFIILGYQRKAERSVKEVN